MSRAVWVALCAAAVSALVACATDAESPKAEAMEEEPMQISTETGWSSLKAMPHVQSRNALPEGYPRARAAWEQGEDAWADKRAEDAAAAFVEAARLLRCAEPTTYSAEFARIRVLALENASLAFRQAGEAKAGAAALRDAAAHDAENAERLIGLADALDG